MKNTWYVDVPAFRLPGGNIELQLKSHTTEQKELKFELNGPKQGTLVDEVRSENLWPNECQSLVVVMMSQTTK